MAVPGAVTSAVEKGNEMIEKLRNEGIAPVPGTPPIVTPPVETPPVSQEPITPSVGTPPSMPSIDKVEIDRLVRERLAELENTNTGRLRVTAEENRLLKGQLQALETRLKELEAKPAIPEIPAADIAVRRAELVQQDGAESETVKAFDRDVANQQQISRLTEEIGKLNSVIENVQTHVVQGERTKYTSALDAGVPKWKEHVNDPRYTDFLSLRAPFTSKTFLELAQEADQRCDAGTSVEILQQFEKFVTPSGTPKPNTPPANGKDNLVAPDTKPGVKPDVLDKNKRIYSLAEATKIKNEITSGRFKGTPEEKQKISSDLSVAAFEGRIR